MPSVCPLKYKVGQKGWSSSQSYHNIALAATLHYMYMYTYMYITLRVHEDKIYTYTLNIAHRIDQIIQEYEAKR